MLPSFTVKVIKSVNNSEVSVPHEQNLLLLTSEHDLIVLDLWHTKCTRCPAYIEKLNNLAADYQANASVGFYTCALSQGGSDMDLVEDLVIEYENLLVSFSDCYYLLFVFLNVVGKI
jgi:thiol-disulfide isomerase/thioredoxin